MNTLWCS